MTNHNAPAWPAQTVGTALAGRVHGAMRPLPDTIVTLTDRAGAQVARSSTGQGGEFQFTGLEPGSYVAIFARPGYEPHAEVVVPSAVPMDVTLEPTTSVRGVVHDRDSPSARQPSPLSDRTARSSPARCPTPTAPTR
jgi:hypothetical protein